MGDGLADALHFHELRLGGGEDLREGAEALQEGLGQRLGVRLADHLEEEQFEQFVVAQRLAAFPAEAFLGALAVADIVRRFARLFAEALHAPWRGDAVKISQPVAVTPTVCSYWAERERSRVTAVHPSERIFTCGRPRLIMGSTVKIMPGRSSTPSPGLP